MLRLWRVIFTKTLAQHIKSNVRCLCCLMQLWFGRNLGHTDWLNMTLCMGYWESLISLSVLQIWAMKVNKSVWGQPLMFVDLSVEDGSDLYLNQISFLTLTVAHSSSLSTPLTHINTHTHIFACTHPSCCTPTQRKWVGYKSKLYPVWVFSWCLWQLTRQGNNCVFSHIKLALSGNA